MTAGHRPPSSPRGLSGFCLASSKRIQGVQKFKGSRGPAPVLSVVRKRNEEDEETLADKSSTAHEHVHRTYHAGDRGPGHGARMGELYSLQPWTGRRA